MAFREAGGPTGLHLEIDHPSRVIDLDRLHAVIERVVADHEAALAYLGVILTDRETVHHLNREHLEHDYPTDVLSFPLDEQDAVVNGEIYVDLDMAAERAPEFGVGIDAEAARYVVHGLLHLLGYDDATPEQGTTMRRLEDRYLGEVGLLD